MKKMLLAFLIVASVAFAGGPYSLTPTQYEIDTAISSVTASLATKASAASVTTSLDTKANTSSLGTMAAESLASFSDAKLAYYLNEGDVGIAAGATYETTISVAIAGLTGVGMLEVIVLPIQSGNLSGDPYMALVWQEGTASGSIGMTVGTYVTTGISAAGKLTLTNNTGQTRYPYVRVYRRR